MSAVLPVPTEGPPARRVFEPVRLGASTLRNRIVCSPISTNMGDEDGSVTPEILHFYTAMGEAGVGLVTIGAAAVSPEGGSTANTLHIGPPHCATGLRKLASCVKETGARVSLQLFHVGAQGNTNYTGQPVLGPSPYICPDIGIEARPLEVEEIQRIERDFAEAILSGLDYGFDFVELHIAHGYLLHQFLSPFFNHRTDLYGGTPENRLRIIRNIIGHVERASKIAMSRCGARISGHDFLENGLTIAANRSLVECLDAAGCPYWVVSAGIYETARQKYVHMNQGDYWRYAAELKAVTRRPVVAQGGIRTLRQGEAVLEAGQGDLIGMAQALIADPDLIKKTREDRETDISLCTQCRRCRYIRRRDLEFDCLLPEGYHPTRKIKTPSTAVSPNGA